MADTRRILQALKECGTSSVIRYLTADHAIPTVSQGITVYLSKDAKMKSPFHTPRIVKNGDRCPHYAYVVPEVRRHYKPLLFSDRALNDLGLIKDDHLVEYCQGSKIYYDNDSNIFPYALAYAGFQFGEFAGQLGDGRVSNLFELRDSKGQCQVIQLKGSGLTPFSRFADGNAVLRSSIREFLVSETLHAIGIPTTRALQLTLLPGTKAKRGSLETCAMVTRFAPSWIRLGNFDLFRWRGDDKGLFQLTDYCIDHVFNKGENFPRNLSINVFSSDYFPDPDEKISEGSEDIDPVEDISLYDLFYRHVVNLNAECVAYWQAYGFCNGVLNTDNTSILGLSLDFGPFGFMDKYQPRYTPNHDDISYRYSFENQPSIIWWNLSKFAEALVLLLGSGTKDIETVKSIQKRSEFSAELVDSISQRATSIAHLSRNEYKFRFTAKYADLMAKRLGISLDLPSLTDDNVTQIAAKVREFMEKIVSPLLEILHVTQVDYNNFFVALQNYNGSFTDINNGIEGLDKNLVELFFTREQVQKLSVNYNRGVSDSGFSKILVETLGKLFVWTVHYKQYIPSYDKRYEIQRKVNPHFVPRNHIFEEVLDDIIYRQRDFLDDPDYTTDLDLLTKLYHMSTNPFEPELWKHYLDDSFVKKWVHGTTEMSNESCMKQCGCSS
ncbi:Fmp40p Ecym_2172 [Eremothecium cymbalariae DBVPG|uniref:Selenoprotein O n=1 Tax=Eremothecium cymbalariae (strain CBS 270.75 / DBVPG 7215 / KCTC 17166 / NRRL Y-17582) TaxID=931890 RepID=G8JNK7_ERECY|nr:Hypothetical protein Ecym_2172 [Eremothecium cymbalariae DBVPG\